MSWVNKVSEEAIDPENLLNAPEPEVQALGRFYQKYQEHLKEENYLDFSTIQVEALRLLEKHPYILIDFKSEKKPDFVSDRERVDRYRRQLEVYAHIIEGRTEQKISRMHLYYTGEDDSNPYVSFNKDTRSIDRTMATFDGIVERIENKDFEIATRPDGLCRNCDMKAYCDAK